MLAFLIALPLASGCGAKRATDAVKQVTVAELGNGLIICLFSAT
jgi:hypothetical protein